MTRIIAAAALLLAALAFPLARAQATCPALAFTFSNGTIADATQVNGDNTGLLNCINGIDAGQITTGTISGARLPGGGTFLANSLGSDVLLNNTANYFDGPTVAQGVSGTWFATGTITATDNTVGTGAIAQIWCKLWDGTTVISSGAAEVVSQSSTVIVSLSGYLAAPAGNLRISCRDSNTTLGVIKFNSTGNSKDSTLSATRIN